MDDYSVSPGRKPKKQTLLDLKTETEEILLTAYGQEYEFRSKIVSLLSDLTKRIEKLEKRRRK